MSKAYKTQWVGQYAVASELTRRDYLVSMPLGNAPNLDLQCQSQNTEKRFAVQAKSLNSKGFFLMQAKFLERKNPTPNLYFVFVYLPRDESKHLEYFVLSHKQLLSKVWKEVKWDKRRREKERRKRGLKHWKIKGWEGTHGINYKFLNTKAYRNKWKNLPH